MTIRTVSFTSLLLLFAIAVPVHAESPPAGFTAIFNGKDLSGWTGNTPHTTSKSKTDADKNSSLAAQQKDFLQHWKVVDGALVNDGHGPYATTGKKYGDMELLLEYKTVARADSGIYLRGNPQVQIWDYTDTAKFKIGADLGSGGLWNNPAGSPGKDPLVKADNAFGEWNKFRIRQVGARTSVWLNGKMVVDNAIMHNYFDKKLPLPREGHIHLQTHGGEIQWRNIFIREIDAEEGNRILGERDSSGFESVFNGEDTSGWKGAVNNYEIIDGAIQCKKGKGGHIYTEATYGDFVARLEFRLPPGGNNGLAIRYPGSGDPAYAGMCELQVLDSEHKKYKDRLDPRQYHGSAYGMTAATRGFLRPTGEWNFQEVTVKGSTIQVELNGNVILQTDLSKVTDLMGNRPHPGKDLKTGHFGFAGHNDPVAFRRVMIRKL